LPEEVFEEDPERFEEKDLSTPKTSAVHPPFEDQDQDLTPRSVLQRRTQDQTQRFHAFWQRIQQCVSARVLSEDMPEELRAWLNGHQPESLQEGHQLQVFWKQFQNGTASKAIARNMPDDMRAWLECAGTKRKCTGAVQE